MQKLFCPRQVNGQEQEPAKHQFWKRLLAPALATGAILTIIIGGSYLLGWRYSPYLKYVKNSHRIEYTDKDFALFTNSYGKGFREAGPENLPLLKKMFYNVTGKNLQYNHSFTAATSEEMQGNYAGFCISYPMFVWRKSFIKIREDILFPRAYEVLGHEIGHSENNLRKLPSMRELDAMVFEDLFCREINRLKAKGKAPKGGWDANRNVSLGFNLDDGKGPGGMDGQHFYAFLVSKYLEKKFGLDGAMKLLTEHDFKSPDDLDLFLDGKRNEAEKKYMLAAQFISIDEYARAQKVLDGMVADQEKEMQKASQKELEAAAKKYGYAVKGGRASSASDALHTMQKGNANKGKDLLRLSVGLPPEGKYDALKNKFEKLNLEKFGLDPKGLADAVKTKSVY